MMDPSVQVHCGTSAGGGTVVASVPAAGADTWTTFVLTAHHVVRHGLAGPSGSTDARVSFYGTAPGTRTTATAQVVLASPRRDLALLRLVTGRKHPAARLAGETVLARVGVGTPVYAVGCPMRCPPRPTDGIINDTSEWARGNELWGLSASAFWGNSGGGVFDARTLELLAVYSKLRTFGPNHTPIPHMGLAVPGQVIREWLTEHGYGHLLTGAAE